MSPLVWDLAHVGNQEELWLVRDVGGREPVRLRHRRAVRRVQARRAATARRCRCCGPAEARAYVADRPGQGARPARRGAAGRAGRWSTDGFAFGMIVQHEQQHDETMLATHQLRAGAAGAARAGAAAGRRLPAPAAEVLVPAGEFTMGTSTEPWALDNERPAHRVHVAAYGIDTAPVTNARVRGLHRRRRVRRPALVDRGRLGAPAVRRAWARRVFWQRDGDDWWRTAVRRGSSRCAPDEPVVHVCWYEAEAYAALGRQAAADRGGVGEGGPVGPGDAGGPAATRGATTIRPPSTPTSASGTCGRRRSGAYPAGASPLGVHQLIGDVWEWTSTRLRTATRGSPRSRTASTRRCSSGRSTRCCAAARSAPTGRLPGHVPQLGLPDPPADLQPGSGARGTASPRPRPTAADGG